MIEHHDFTKPYAKNRKRIYTGVAAVMAAGYIVTAGGTGLGIFPTTPITGLLACIIFTNAIWVAFWACWFVNGPGEKRTTLEKADEFTMLWACVAAVGSELTWELPWLVADALGRAHITPNDRWVYIWYYYARVDERYLHSDGALWGIEAVVVLAAVLLLVQWFRLRGTPTHDPKRISALWWSLFAMTVMLTIFVVYYAAEVRHGFPNVQRGFWDLTVIFVYENLPWLLAPMISIPFTAMQLAYLYREQGRRNALAQTDDLMKEASFA